MIIPTELRVHIRKEGLRSVSLLIALFTILNIYRVLPTKVKPSLKSIEDPFTGIYKTFEMRKILLSLKDLGIRSLAMKRIRLIGGESAGPNSGKAIWGADTDVFAFFHDPLRFVHLVRWLIFSKAYFYVFYFILLGILGSPFYLISLMLGGRRAYMGRLSVVYDQAGKARIVAITNWWFQLCLKPLHDAIFAKLSQIECDGTFNQHRPLDRLIQRVGGKCKYYSFDLTAATDRLPVDLQTDILVALGLPGHLWKDLLSINWMFHGKPVRYSVGQPMGAYSSWAMLALTHHVIVRLAALEAGKTDFSNYALLGDDLVIADDDVAQSYLNLMKGLGLEINLSKSVISNDFAEFAKVWKGVNLNFSPIGPGLILRTIRDKVYINRLLMEVFDRGLFQLSDLVVMFSKRPTFLVDTLAGFVWTYVLHQTTNNTVDTGNALANPVEQSVLFEVASQIIPTGWSVFERQIKQRYDRDWQTLLASVRFFILYGWRTTQTKLGPVFFTDLALYPLKPAFWYYLHSFVISFEDHCKRYVDLNDEDLFSRRIANPQTWKRWMDLAGMINIRNIDWAERSKLRQESKLERELIKVLWSPRTIQDEMMLSQWDLVLGSRTPSFSIEGLTNRYRNVSQPSTKKNRKRGNV